MIEMIEKRFKGSATGTDLSKDELTVKNVRVAAYCRVSTDMETQLGSLETQMDVFRQRIQEHPGWELVDIYADRGKTGTSVHKRPEFLRMANDVENGKIDYIITKSISRFARNTVECLSYVRKFQAHGVNILFEKENVDTNSELSEMLLTILAAFAQEESKSISDHMKWGLRKRFAEGTGRWKGMYGFRRGENDEHVIVPEEAAVVRRIFDMYLHGESGARIASQLTEEGIPGPNGGAWGFNPVFDILSNERYIGDIQLQKYVSTDHLTHASRRNDETKVPSYYVSGHHEPIVSKEVFNMANRIKEIRNERPGQTVQYPYADVDMRCPHCGEQLIRRRYARHSGFYAWGCFGEKGCGKYGLRDSYLDTCILKCYKARWGKEEKEVHYYWLAQMVKQIIPTDTKVRVIWFDGSESEIKMNFKDCRYTPAFIADRYRFYIMDWTNGKYMPVPKLRENAGGAKKAAYQT